MSATIATMPTARIKDVALPVSRLVLGTMIVTTDEEARSFTLLDEALALGCNSLDTAYVYAGGNSERCIGKWMEARGNRAKMVILSKGCHPNGDRRRVTPYDIGSDILDSLARLRTTYMDMWVLHRDDEALPVGPIVEALNEHRTAGRIHAFGGSNWTHTRLAEANEYAYKHNLTPMAISSPHFSLAEQVDNPWGPGCVGISGPSGADARAWYAKNGLHIFAYSSLARGFFSGRVTSADQREGAKAKVDGACFNAYCHPCNFERLRRAEELGREKGLTVPQVATAYVMNHPLNIFGCVGAASGAELAANIAAATMKLTPAEMAWLNLERDSR